jgi:restriction system protein
MARRSKSSPADDFIAIVALMPWWAGVIMGVGAYLLLHHWARQPVIVAVQPAQVGTIATQVMWRGLAGGGQYFVPFICFIGAAVSAWRRKERRQLVADVAQSRCADALDGISWQEFEKLVGEGFRLRGYRVTETGGGGADGGIDLALTKGSEKFLVQCKQWRALKVGVSVVRELYGVMAARGATGGFVVTSGRFTDEAKAFASGRNVSLIDGPELLTLIRSAGSAARAPAPTVAPPRAKVPPASVPPASAPTAALAQPAPACPVCAKAMVKRVAKRGASAGGAFWGCSAYPSCRGTRAIG